MVKKCTVTGNRINPCNGLGTVYVDENGKRNKGIVFRSLVDAESFVFSRNAAILISSPNAGTKHTQVELNFCPFCGESIRTRENKND